MPERIAATTLPHPPKRCYEYHDLEDAKRDLPQSLLLPHSLSTTTTGRRVLFHHHQVLHAPRETCVHHDSSNSCTSNSMSLKAKRWKDRWHDIKRRSSPVYFPYAGLIFLVIILVAVVTVIVGWFGLTVATIAMKHPMNSSAGAVSSATTTEWPAPPDIAAGGFKKKELEVARTAPPPPPPATEITVLHTTVVTDTITELVTETYTTILHTPMSATMAPTRTPVPTTTTTARATSTPTTTGDASTSSMAGDTMTGRMYCTFADRPNIYTLCPWVHTSQPGMLDATAVPAVAFASGSTSRMRNPFSGLRLAVMSLWNSVPALGRNVHGKERMDEGDGGCVCDYDCDCADLRRRLHHALDLVRVQQQLLDSQAVMMKEHRRSFAAAVEVIEAMKGSSSSSSEDDDEVV
ncbi:Uu.00g068580.m01.CDS01 [Anthostomella pinea]|uniref:Uu.00g068580.m01.CDS01 n=1 Tax=Anthostomella pinea TaxID=933095 RepID=A0AAI8VVJ7_9PEZI|nr:Uu.00g068580.m01.CDS01 [Anthostomella pinea]